jgi:hypothetical protein
MPAMNDVTLRAPTPRPAAAALTAALLATACGSTPAARPPTPAECAAELRTQHGIDVTPEPRVCAPLREALLRLGDASRERVHGVVIVRDHEGRCGADCPDLAAALMSDGTLAYYAIGRHELHVLDATFDGPRWRGGSPDPAQLREYLAGLGLADWPALVERVRAIPGVELPADVPEGSPLVLDAIVRHGPAALLGGPISVADLLLHELGHAVLLHGIAESERVHAWATLGGWAEADGEVADGYVGGFFASEQPIVASRLLLGLPRGGDPYYRPGGVAYPTGGLGFPTGYAAFDPVEDHAEAFRLAHTDPEALGAASPARLLVAGAGELDLRRPTLRRFVHAGVAALLEPPVDPQLAMATLRAYGAALLPEAADLADPRPLPIPADADAETRAMIAEAQLEVTIGDLHFRPGDAAFAAFLERWLRARRDLEEFQRGIDALGNH